MSLINKKMLRELQSELHYRWIGVRTPARKPSLRLSTSLFVYATDTLTPVTLSGSLDMVIFLKDIRTRRKDPVYMDFTSFNATVRAYLTAGFYLEAEWLRVLSVVHKIADILDKSSHPRAYTIDTVFPDLHTLLDLHDSHGINPPTNKRWPVCVRRAADRDMKNEIKHANEIFSQLLLIPESNEAMIRGNTWNHFDHVELISVERAHDYD